MHLFAPHPASKTHPFTQPPARSHVSPHHPHAAPTFSARAVRHCPPGAPQTTNHHRRYSIQPTTPSPFKSQARGTLRGSDT
jgi:hypothetical protein